MANAFSGQAEIAFGAPPTPVRPLHFFSAQRGRYFIDSFGDYFYRIRAATCSEGLIWETTILRRGHRIGIAKAFLDLGAAVDYLQAEARKRGGLA